MVRRRILVAGGAGFLGSHLCDRLTADGHHVVAVDNFVTGSPDNVAHLGGDPRFELVEADVTTPLPLLGPLSAVLHFASPASPVHYQRLALETLRVGSVGTENLLRLAAEHGARFLLASTSETYGDPAVHPQPERYWGNVNPVGPRSMYDESKRFAEALTVAYRRTTDIDAKIVRIFNTYGERMQPDDGRAVPTFIRQALAGEPITVAGDGSQTRSLCYVSDLVEGVQRLLWSGQAGPVNIGNPQELSILELATVVRRTSGSASPVVFIDRPVDDPTVRCPDIALARRALQWQPQVDLPTGLARTVEWFRRRGHADTAQPALVPGPRTPDLAAAGAAGSPPMQLAAR